MEKIALLFPGQGSQYIGMGKQLCSENPIAKQTFELASDTLDQDISHLCFEGPARELNRFENALLAIFVVNIATYRVFTQKYGIIPVAGVGHSLGELSALVCSGMVDFKSMIKLIEQRSRLAVELKKNGRMTVVNGCTLEQIKQICNNEIEGDSGVFVACYNSFDQFVLAGERLPVMQMEKNLMINGINATPLLTSPPIHTPLMSEISVIFKEKADKIPIHKNQWPVIANFHAKAYSYEEGISNLLTNQMTHAVRWTDCILTLKNMGTQMFLELGPQSILTEMNRKYYKEIPSFSYNQRKDREMLDRILKPVTSNDAKKYRVSIVTKCLAEAVSVKNWNTKITDEEYQLNIIEPYHKIRNMQIDLQKNNLLPSTQQEEEALSMLKQVLVYKQVPTDEQERILSRIQ